MGKKDNVAFDGGIQIQSDVSPEMLTLEYAKSQIFIEPVTFTVAALWVLEKLVGGTLEEIGEQLYSKLTGTTNNMTAPLNKMVADIKKYIDFRFQRAETEEILKILDTVRNIHLDFLRAPSRDRLHILTIKIEDAYTKAKNNQSGNIDDSVRTHEMYINAVSEKLLILRQREIFYPENAIVSKILALALIHDAKMYLDIVMDRFFEITRDLMARTGNRDRAAKALFHGINICSGGDSIMGHYDRYAYRLRQEIDNSLRQKAMNQGVSNMTFLANKRLTINSSNEKDEQEKIKAKM